MCPVDDFFVRKSIPMELRFYIKKTEKNGIPYYTGYIFGEDEEFYFDGILVDRENIDLLKKLLTDIPKEEWHQLEQYVLKGARVLIGFIFDLVFSGERFEKGEPKTTMIRIVRSAPSVEQIQRWIESHLEVKLSV